MVAQVPSAIESDIKCYDYLSHKYAEMKMQDERKKLKNDKIRDRFAYIKSTINAE